MIHPIDLVRGCSLEQLTVRGDDRGSLIALEGGRGHLFAVERVYYIYGTRPGVSRGFHAHFNLDQLAVAVSGACTMRLDDGTHKADVRLDRPDLGVRIGSLIWREMHDFSEDCVLMVLASRRYDDADYIRSYDAFRRAVASHMGQGA